MSDLPEGRGSGRLDFEAAIRQGLAAAAAQGWNSIVLCDADFADWPLGERAVVDALNRWARRGRTLKMLARHYDQLRLQHPRFVQWRVTWARRLGSNPGASNGNDADGTYYLNRFWLSASQMF